MRPIPLEIIPYHIINGIAEAEKQPATSRTIDEINRKGGFIAQEVLKDWFDVEHSGIPKYDFLFRKLQIETKCTVQNVTHEPKPHYEGSVGDYYEHDCHYYLFTRIHHDERDDCYGNTLWVMGYATPDMVINEKNHVKKGDIIGSNDHEVSVPCYKIKYSELFMPEELRIN